MPGVIENVPVEEKSASEPLEKGEPTATAQSFWSRLTGLPLVVGCQEALVAQKKEHSWLGAGADLLKLGVGLVVAPTGKALANTFPDAVATLDKAACRVLDTTEKKATFLQKTPHEVASDVQSSTKSAILKACKTYPGRKLLKGLDVAITVSENLLDKIEPKEEEPVSEEEEKVPKEEESDENRDAATQTTGAISKILATLKLEPLANWILETKLKPLVKVLLVTPLEKWVWMLKWIRKLLPREKLKPRRPKLTPEKAKEIERRRKASPKKRVKKSLVYKSVSYLLNLFGLSKVTKQMDIRLYLSKTDDTEKTVGRHDKRKHDDVYDSSEESDQMELHDLEQYQSDDDPDYKPDDQRSEDSLEYRSGDTESDIEEEPQTSPSKRSSGLVQIKGEPKIPPKEAKIPPKEAKLAATNGSHDKAVTDGSPGKATKEAKGAKKDDITERKTEEKPGKVEIKEKVQDTKTIAEKASEKKEDLLSGKPMDVKLQKLDALGKQKGTAIY